MREIAMDAESRCPRCGQRGVMYAEEVFNKLSRFREGLFICRDCGTEEALGGGVLQPDWWIDTDAEGAPEPDVESGRVNLCFDCERPLPSYQVGLCDACQLDREMEEEG